LPLKGADTLIADGCNAGSRPACRYRGAPALSFLLCR
jgi:hypothetical protein